MRQFLLYLADGGHGKGPSGQITDSDVSTTKLSVKLGCIQKFRRYGCHGDETLDP